MRFAVRRRRSFAPGTCVRTGRRRADSAGALGATSSRGSPSTLSYGDTPVMTVHAGSLNPAALAAAGFTEIGRPGYYGPSANDRRPNSTAVPVIGLAIGPVSVPAQLDTGFDDDRDPGIVQGNTALLAALREQGVVMHPAPARSTKGCDGLRPYPRWRIELGRAGCDRGRRIAGQDLSVAASRDQG